MVQIVAALVVRTLCRSHESLTSYSFLSRRSHYSQCVTSQQQKPFLGQLSSHCPRRFSNEQGSATSPFPTVPHAQVVPNVKYQILLSLSLWMLLHIFVDTLKTTFLDMEILTRSQYFYYLSIVSECKKIRQMLNFYWIRPWVERLLSASLQKCSSARAPHPVPEHGPGALGAVSGGRGGYRNGWTTREDVAPDRGVSGPLGGGGGAPPAGHRPPPPPHSQAALLHDRLLERHIQGDTAHRHPHVH